MLAIPAERDNAEKRSRKWENEKRLEEYIRVLDERSNARPNRSREFAMSLRDEKLTAANTQVEQVGLKPYSAALHPIFDDTQR